MGALGRQMARLATWRVGQNPMPVPGQLPTPTDRAKEQGAVIVVVSHPEELGDTYEEMVESLSRVAELGLQVVAAELSGSRRWGGPTGGTAR
jgi:hypothetical protein